MARKIDTRSLPIKVEPTMPADVEARLNTIARRITEEALSKTDAVEYISVAYGIKEKKDARKLYDEAMKLIVPEDPDGWRNEHIYRNVELLDNLIERAVRNKDFKMANSLINTQNKMLGLGGGRFEITATQGRNNDFKIIIE